MEHVSAVYYSRPYLTGAQIENLATQSGISTSKGHSLRYEGWNLISSTCKALNLPIRTFDVAMTLYLHSLIYSSTKVNYSSLSGACILLGMKMQDTPKKCRDLSAAILKIQGKTYGTKEIEEFRIILATQEQQVLETIAFDFRFENPHYYVIKLSKKLGLNSTVGETAWNIATDMYLTWAPLRQPSHTMALASIILAAKLHEVNSIFPVDSPSLYSERSSVNECLADVLALYIENFSTTVLSKCDGITKANLDFFESLAKPIGTELSKGKKKSPLEGLLLHDPKVSARGTAEYLLHKP